MAVIEDLSEEEKYLWAILQDESGLDIAEFSWYDPEQNDGCFRAWSYQWKWWRCSDPLQIDQSARSVGKSLSIKVRAFAFPFIHPGQEMVITAPEGVHLDAITDVIETAFYNTRLGNEMLVRGVRGAVKHKPFHCVAEGQLVLTARGHIPIEQVIPGDLVLTHNARWREVVDVLDQGVQPVVSASGRGHYGIKVTEDHKFYARNGRWSPRTRGKKTIKQLEDPSWISPQYWVTSDEKQIKLFTHWASPAVVPEIEQMQFDPSLELLWMCGLYVAEGCVSGKNVIFTTHANEVEEVSKRLAAADLVFRISSQDQPNRPSLAYDFTVRNAEALASFLGANFGRGSKNKRLPAWVWSLTDAQKIALFEGYAFGDGNEVRQGAVRLVTSSKALACDMKLLAQTLGYQCGFFAREPSTSFIGGRVINAGPSWEVYVDRVPHTRKHTRDLPDGMHVWSSTAQYQSSGTERTYDLVVEEDHSFVVEGIVVHNCNFSNGARIMGRIPQRDGKGVKGCKVEGELIWTERGLLSVEQLVVGDRVITHQGHFKPITGIFPDITDCYEVRGQSSFPERVSCDHRFMGASNLSTSKQKRRLSETYFQDVEFLIEDQWYWASPTRFPELPVPEVQFWSGCRPFDTDNVEFWWLTGRYLADGHLSAHRPNSKSGSVNWCVVPERAEEINSRLQVLGLTASAVKRLHSSADMLSINSSAWHNWILEHFGKLATGKEIPTWALGMPESNRKALLEGYLSGDGHVSKSKNRIELGTASKKLAVGLQLLAQSLGYTVNCSEVTPKTTHINGVKLKNSPNVSFRLQLLTTGHPIIRDDYLYSKVKSVEPIGKRKVYDIRVADDHSYLSGSIMSHNIHPLWLELDEAQDYPEAGWTELTETLKRGSHGAVWRAHGVTRGVRDRFWKNTQPDSQWTVHRYPAMYRPTWTDSERTEKIEQYGGRDDPDYRRNVLGLHGDAMSPIFVLHRLMQCVDDNKESTYNEDEYFSLKVSDSYLTERSLDILDVLNFPQYHIDRYKTFWSGMDVGYTNHPSEILVFAEERPPTSEMNVLKKLGKAVPPEGMPRLKLIVRLNLTRIGINDQVRAILRIVDFYKPRAFSMDKTGNGLPLFQDAQDKNMQKATIIKGYGFSEKILVDFDQTVEVESDIGNNELAKEAGIRRNTVEYATDVLRGLVDDKRLWLPWDDDLLSEFMGQTYKVERSGVNQYGKRSYSLGKFHALDAARMAVLGWKQFAIEKMMKEEKAAPVYDMFVQF